MKFSSHWHAKTIWSGWGTGDLIEYLEKDQHLNYINTLITNLCNNNFIGMLFNNLVNLWTTEIDTELHTTLLDKGEANDQSHLSGFDWHPETHHLRNRPDHLAIVTLSVWKGV